MARRYITRRALSLRPVDSIKNVVDDFNTITTTTQQLVIAKAKDSPVTTVNSDVKRGCAIKAIWCSFDVCGTGTSGTIQKTGLYIIKNPGNNLAIPGVFSVGTSNEKKFIFKQWQFMTMRNQDGNPPFHWEGWIKIPRRYQRMGTDDLLQMVWANDTLTGHMTSQFIYKWYS